MTEIEDPDRCPRCGSHDLAIVSSTRYAKGDRFILSCEQCAAMHQRFARFNLDPITGPDSADKAETARASTEISRATKAGSA